MLERLIKGLYQSDNLGRFG